MWKKFVDSGIVKICDELNLDHNGLPLPNHGTKTRLHGLGVHLLIPMFLRKICHIFSPIHHHTWFEIKVTESFYVRLKLLILEEVHMFYCMNCFVNLQPFGSEWQKISNFTLSSLHTAWIGIWMTKRPGATSDNGFIFKKINEN